MIRKFFLVLAASAALLSLLTAVPAQAQFNGPSASSGLTAINRIIRNTPGISSVSVGGSTTVSASAAESVAVRGGLSIPIPMSASASVAGSAMASTAAKIMKVGGLVGAASVILPMIIDKANIYVCPPPDFFCKPDPSGPMPADLYGTYTARANSGATTCLSTADHCDYLAAAKASCRGAVVSTAGVSGPNPIYIPASKVWSFSFSCSPNFGGSIVSVMSSPATSCPAGYSLSNGQCVRDGANIPSVPATEGDISGPLTTAANSSPTNQKNLYDVLRQNGANVFTGGEPVNVTAPPVVAQPRTTTQTITNPDGTTSTQTITEESTITPQVSGSTLANTTVTYPTQTKVTTTTTNNTTNVTTTYITYINEYAQPNTTDKGVDIPTDYARENTLQQVARNTSADGAPILPDQGAVVTAATTKATTDMATIRSGVATDHTGADRSSFFSFLWTPPVGTCAASSATVHGWSVSLDPCPTVNNIRDVLGWILALFTGWSIWGLLFKGD